MIKAVLFDLDGVITDSAKLHYKAWKAVANRLSSDIDEQFNESLKGVDRVNSLNRLLRHINVEVTEDEFQELLKWKNDYYVKLLDTLNHNDILPGIESFIVELKNKGIKLSVASASKNAPVILKKLNLIAYFDAIADPNDIKKGKPAPDIFLLAANLVNITPEECVGVEDAQVGIDALNLANIKSIAIGETLKNATVTLKDTSELDYQLLSQI